MRYGDRLSGLVLFRQARFVWRDVIQVAAVVNCLELKKRVLMHGGGHPAQDLMVRKCSKLNRLVTVARSQEIPCFKDGSCDRFGPTMEQAEFRRSHFTWLRADDALCANQRSHCLDTSRPSAQT